MPQQQQLLSRGEIGVVYATGIFLCLPLYMADGFVRLIDGKTVFFYLITAVAAAACLIHALGRRRARSVPGALPKPDVSCLALAGLCAVYLLNLLLAADPSAAFWGLDGRHNGTLMLLACAACWCILRYTVRGRQTLTLFRLLLAGACAAGLLGWLNYFLIDPLNVYYILDHDKARIFLSTIGNVNFFGALMAMGAALASGLCLRAQTQKAAARYGAATAVLAVSLVPANSDAAWLGFFAAMAVLVCGRGLRWEQCARLFWAGAGFFALALLFGLGARSLPVRDELDALSALFSRPAVAGAGALACLALGMLLRKDARPCTRIVRGCTAALLALLAALLLLANLTPVPLGALEGILRFSQSWGSGRGYVWGRLLYVYRDELTPLQMLIGAGGDSVNALINPHYTEYILAINGLTYDSAHNVYVQQLLCGGVLGLACWLLFLGARLLAGLRHASPAALALVAYCVQAFFSIDMPAVLATAFALAALTEPAPEQPGEPAPRRAVALAGSMGLFLFCAALTPSLL